MDWLEYQMGYDKKTKEMIIFEFDDNEELVELGRFKYNMEQYCDAENVEQITIGFLRIFDDGKLIEIKEVYGNMIIDFDIEDLSTQIANEFENS